MYVLICSFLKYIYIYICIHYLYPYAGSINNVNISLTTFVILFYQCNNLNIY